MAAIIVAAADLLGPPADRDNVNPEYERALVDLTCFVLGVRIEGRDLVQQLIEEAAQ